MAEVEDPKTVLHRFLQDAREDLIWKLDGLGERDARLPRTPTGTNLLGILKHCLNVEAGYFGPTFGRDVPAAHELVPMEAYEDDPQADWYAREDETKDGIIDLYRRVGAFVDQTVLALPLDAPGTVPWWTPARAQVTLQQVIVHVTCDLARHAGHADVLRELHDGSTGWQRDNSNVPDGYDWPAYVTKLTELAHRFAEPRPPGGARPGGPLDELADSGVGARGDGPSAEDPTAGPGRRERGPDRVGLDGT